MLIVVSVYSHAVVDVFDSQQKTPLMLACESSFAADKLALLLSNGANPAAKDLG